MSVKIHKLTRDDPLLERVIELADQNKSRLGLIPYGAFPQFAGDGLILAALIDDSLAGYTLYRYVKSRNEVSITHLCVEPSCRGRRVASSLVRHLSEEFSIAYGISLKCRVDYGLERFWKKLGFVIKREVPGRSKDGSLLHLWWRDHGHPNIFSETSGADNNRLKVVVDANVFYDLFDESRPERESLGLMADWLVDEIDLYYTPELENEIYRGSDPERKKSQRQSLTKLICTRVPAKDFDDSSAKLLAALPQSKGGRDDADRRHLAWAVSSNAEIFLSRDTDLINQAEEYLSGFDIEVLRPSELIVRLDSLHNEAPYTPTSVAGVQALKSARPSKIITKDVMPFVASHHREKARDIADRLRTLAAEPRKSSVILVKNDDTSVSCVGIRHKGDTSYVEFMRIYSKFKYSRLLASEVVARCTSECVGRGTEFISNIDEFSGPMLERALKELGFLRRKGMWLKWCRRAVRDLSEIRLDLENFPARYQWLADRIKPQLALADAGEESAYKRLEHIVWPLKIKGSPLRNFILPIRPQWAKELFDSEYAQNDLFGCDPKLMLRRENAYYRSASGVCPPSGSRLLWYVSAQVNYPNSKAIRACAIVESATVLPARAAFRSGRRFGVYEWPHVLKTAHDNPEASVMLIIFSAIEEFPFPQPFDEVNAILARHDQSPNQMQSITPIAEPAFEEIYLRGMGIYEH